MEPSKPGRGILASLEHKAAEPSSRRPATAVNMSMPGAALVVAGGVLAGALLAWWLSSGPSPVIVHEALPPFVQAAPARPAGVPMAASEAAAIVDEAPPPALAHSPALPASSPAAKAVTRHDRAATTRPHAPPKAERMAARKSPRPVSRAVPDADVVLLSALVTHVNEREVVEVRPGDGTASLLQRCRRVGGAEGRLCHVRICSSRGGGDDCSAE